MLNTPNILSIFRICLVPVFIISYFSGIPYATQLAALVYAVALITDFLDGYIARRFNLITNLGRVLDPLGDKMITMAVLACLTIDGKIPSIILIIFTFKELLMGLGGLLLHKAVKVDIPSANLLGKSATVLFFLVCILLMLFDISYNTATILISLALLNSVAAFISYLYGFIKILKKKEPVNPEIEQIK
ncbi:CDP-alcohol phosphatidyltransferase family protein [Clostridiaceae bacterium OttesenSCG-928-D20]|nr:CDP-alcohol phosphatidyltransferase family protein [Clostridiaceae bacterium OttesenSCG-928-D20]